MVKCSICPNQCNEHPTRRWENLLGELGLELVILDGNNPVGNKPICDDCLFKMFWTRLERYHKDYPILKQLKELPLREARCEEMERDLRSRERTVTSVLNTYNRKVLEIENLELKLKELKADSLVADRLQSERAATESILRKHRF